jgi:hypothetical protein
MREMSRHVAVLVSKGDADAAERIVERVYFDYAAFLSSLKSLLPFVLLGLGLIIVGLKVYPDMSRPMPFSVSAEAEARIVEIGREHRRILADSRLNPGELQDQFADMYDRISNSKLS